MALHFSTSQLLHLDKKDNNKGESNTHVQGTG